MPAVILTFPSVDTSTDCACDLIREMQARRCARLRWGYLVDTTDDEIVLTVVMAAAKYRYRVSVLRLDGARCVTFEREP